MNTFKALLLFSGGLDSILAAKILEKGKIKVVPVYFKSYFFNCQLAEKSAKNLGLKLKTIDFSKEHLKIVKKPKHGRGKGMNPCLDCHLLMLRMAKKIMEKEKLDFIATGEVLEERPFSQNKKALFKIEKETGLENQVLRPLSARLLPLTRAEEKNMVKRKTLFAIKGKSRKPQLFLAKAFNVFEFPSPAGGCILTDLEYSKKIKKLFEKVDSFDGNDIQVLRLGRVFWQDKNLFVVGRNEKENKELKKIKKKKDLFLEPINFPGPTVLLRSFDRKKTEKKTILKAKRLLKKYTKKKISKIKIKISFDS